MSEGSLSSSMQLGGIPEDRTGKPSSILSLGWRPQLVTGMLRQHLISHFTDKDTYSDPGLRGCLWESGVGGDISIENITKWKPAEAGSRPAIVLKRGGLQIERKGINDQHMGTFHVDGQPRYTTFFSGSHTVFCMSTVPGEAEKLAAEVYLWLIWFFPVLRCEMKLHRLVVAQIGELQKAAEATDHYVVPITVAYAYEENWINRRQAPLLKTVELSHYRP